MYAHTRRSTSIPGAQRYVQYKRIRGSLISFNRSGGYFTFLFHEHVDIWGSEANVYTLQELSIAGHPISSGIQKRVSGEPIRARAAPRGFTPGRATQRKSGHPLPIFGQ
jgi:hypothetical protein